MLQSIAARRLVSIKEEGTMRQPLVARAAAGLAGLLLGTAGAAFAGAVYLPVPDPVNSSTGSTHVVQVWITNTGGAQGPYTATFLPADSDGTQRTAANPTQRSPIAAGRTSILDGIGTPGSTGLLEIDAAQTMSVEGRLFSTPPTGTSPSVSSVPAISSANLFATGTTAVLLGLRRDLTHGDVANLGIANLAQQAAQCQVKLFRADGSQVATTATLTFKPLSLRSFGDAFGLLGEQQAADARAEVSCNQPFYAYATQYSGASAQLSFILPAASGTSTLTVPGNGTTNPPPTGGGDGSILFTAPGVFHTPSPGNEKKTFQIPVATAMSLKKMVIDMDITPGAWNRAKVPGNHALIWLYRGKFRGNTIANVNAFSPPTSSFKAAQNINLPAGSDRHNDKKITWVQGQKYHIRFTYDAEHGTVTALLTSLGATVASVTVEATAPNNVLDLSPAVGMTAEFGHYANQSGPEVASYGWQYANLQIAVTPY
jgi:hypothetical protein